jgi:hypothetical protein
MTVKGLTGRCRQLLVPLASTGIFRLDVYLRSWLCHDLTFYQLRPLRIWSGGLLSGSTKANELYDRHTAFSGRFNLVVRV